MPELPEVEALARYLRAHAVGHVVARIDVAGMSAVKTVVPPWTALHGRTIHEVNRYGKYLSMDCGGVHVVMHLARAGWLRWHTSSTVAPPKPGRGGLALRVHLDRVGGAGFDLTEAGTQKRLAVWIVADPAEVDGIARLGPDALSLDATGLAAALTGRTERLKTVLIDQARIAGIGNAYSDEILHAARLSPYATAGRLPAAERGTLLEAIHHVLGEAVARSAGQDAAELKTVKRSGMRVHGRAGLPCPACGDAVREVSFAERSLYYCARCQTGGTPLADRRLSRLVK